MHVAPATRTPHAQSSTAADAEQHGHYDRTRPADGPDGPPEPAPDLTPQNGGVGPDLSRKNDGSGLAAAVAGFERWARDQVARRPDPTPAELAEREAIQDAWQREARLEEQERWYRDARADAFL